MSPHYERNKRFWTGLSEYMGNRNGAVTPPIMSDMNYVEFLLPHRGFRLCAAFDSQKPNRKVELLITGKNGDDHAQRLMSQKDEIEEEVGCGLDWNIHLIGKKKVSLWDHGVNVFAGPPSDHYAWYADKLDLLHRVFAPRIRAVR